MGESKKIPKITEFQNNHKWFNLFMHITATDVCRSSPCDNGGSCVGDSTAFTCNCVAGFTGPRCKVSKFYKH